MTRLGLPHHLARTLIGQSLLFVGTLRPEASHAADPLATLGRRFGATGWPGACNCRPLCPAAVAALIGQLAGDGDFARLAGRLYQETEGNPFFLIETLKALFEQGAIRVDAGGSWHANDAILGQGRCRYPPT